MNNEHKKNILIIEDESPVIHALNKVLGQHFNIYEASSGAAGLELALQIQPDLVLLDIILPELSGVEVLQKIREDEWGKTAKVLIISNLSHKEYEEKAHKLGIIEYVIKSSISINDLANKVKSILADK